MSADGAKQIFCVFTFFYVNTLFNYSKDLRTPANFMGSVRKVMARPKIA